MNATSIDVPRDVLYLPAVAQEAVQTRDQHVALAGHRGASMALDFARHQHTGLSHSEPMLLWTGGVLAK